MANCHLSGGLRLISLDPLQSRWKALGWKPTGGTMIPTMPRSPKTSRHSIAGEWFSDRGRENEAPESLSLV